MRVLRKEPNGKISKNLTPINIILQPSQEINKIMTRNKTFYDDYENSKRKVKKLSRKTKY